MILALAVLIAAPLSAADKKKKKGKKERKAPAAVSARLLKGLELTDEQKEQVAALNKEYGPKLADLQKKLALSPEQRKAGAEARKKAKEDGTKRKEAAKAVAAALNLSEAQKEAQKERQALTREIRGKFVALLTPEQKAKVPGGKKGAKKGAKKNTDSKKKKESDS